MTDEAERLFAELREQGVSDALLEKTAAFRRQFEKKTQPEPSKAAESCTVQKQTAGNAVEEPAKQAEALTITRANRQAYVYYGKKVWEEALAALLSGENLLLSGSKATGKNVLAENLACLFGRPRFNISFHINTDASYLIGSDTFAQGAVRFRLGPVSLAASCGGFCILDEINMARNEALAVLHAVLDFRRVIDVPGYPSIEVHPATRFIATMNYGYAGTRELNEALASRFVIIQAPELSGERLSKLLARSFPKLNKPYVDAFTGLFCDIQKKCRNGELSSKALDLRGLLDAIRLMQLGLSPRLAIDMGVTNKTFDSYEQSLLRDIIATRIPERADAASLFQS